MKNLKLGSFNGLSNQESKKDSIKNDFVVNKKKYDAIIAHIIQKFPYKDASISSEDLMQEGWIGIYAGFERFNPEKRVKFETYIGKWIYGAIYRSLCKANGIPDYIQRLIDKYNRIIGDGAYTKEEIKKLTSFSDRELELVAQGWKVSKRITLDANLNFDLDSDSEANLYDVLALRKEEDDGSEFRTEFLEVIKNVVTDTELEIIFEKCVDGISVGKMAKTHKIKADFISKKVKEIKRKILSNTLIKDFYEKRNFEAAIN